MTARESQVECQIYCLRSIPDRNAEVILPPIRRRLELMLARHLNDRTKRAILREVNQLFDWFLKLTSRSTKLSPDATYAAATGLKAGDLVRVRSKEEIEATLDHWKQLKGCTFMVEMQPYCGTTLRVLKPVERFLDERDYRFKRTKGIVFLEGAICEGTERFGPCDRSCFYFWREEWLEKID